MQTDYTLFCCCEGSKMKEGGIEKELEGPYILYNRFHNEITRPRYCETSKMLNQNFNYYDYKP